MTDNPAEQATATPGETIRAKWVMDDSTTLAEAADRLERFAAHLRSLHAQGWTLSGPIVDDHGFLVDPTGNAGPTDAGPTDEDGDFAPGGDSDHP